MARSRTIHAYKRGTLNIGACLLAVSWSIAGCHRRDDSLTHASANPVPAAAAPAASASPVAAADKTQAKTVDTKAAALSAKQIVVAGDHSYILTSEGKVFGMGANEFGALGLPKDIKETRTPAVVPGIAGALQIASGTWHACAVIAGEKAVCWGRNFGGALGNGSVKNEYFVVPSEVVDLAQVAEVGAAGTHSCARLTDGTARCWGCVISGTVERPKVLPKLSQATALALAPESSCARLDDKRVACWDVLLGKEFDYGDAAGGGDGNVKPVAAVPRLRDVRQVSVSATHACAVTEAGLVSCWGRGSEGQLGNGRSGEGNRLLQPTEVAGLSEIDSVSTGTGSSCAVHRDGGVSCWGQNGHGQLGLGDKRLRNRPEKLPSLANVAAVALGTSHSCAVMRSGEVYCWGRNHRGQLGQAPAGPSDTRTTPMRVIW